MGVKTPVPLVLHIPVVVAPLTLPVKGIVKLLAQTVISDPALTIGAGVIVMIKSSVSLSQLLAVSVNVTVPFPASAGLGI